jgi:hypothetical protein
MFVLRPDTESGMVIGFDVGYYAPNGVFVMLATFANYNPRKGSGGPEMARVAEAFKDAAALVSVLNGGDVSAMPPLNGTGWTSVRSQIIEEWGVGGHVMPDGLHQFGEKVGS